MNFPCDYFCHLYLGGASDLNLEFLLVQLSRNSTDKLLFLEQKPALKNKDTVQLETTDKKYHGHYHFTALLSYLKAPRT